MKRPDVNDQLIHSAFVPHTVQQPIIGAESGPLEGLTVAVKDMFDIKGSSASGGSPAWRAAHEPATEHSGAVQRVLNAGATVTGTTVCDEFFYSTVGANAHYGTPVNVRAPGRIPGGSSSGSASAAASGACDFAIGSDTGGSVRVPAALCGVYGIRVTRGRFDFTGSMQMAPTFDAGGWFAATPGVFRRVGKVLLTGQSVPAPVTKAVILEDALECADPDIARIVEEFAEALTGHLTIDRDTATSPGGLDTWREAMRIVQAREVWQTFGPFLQTHTPELGPGIKERMAIASTVTDAEATQARTILTQATARMEELTPTGTVLIVPTTAVIAPLLDEAPEGLETYRVNGMRLSCMTSISGQPQITLPIATLNGAPVGISLIGWPGADETLLNLTTTLSTLAGAINHTTHDRAPATT
ncbi:amidase [Paenarthrobacter sp. NPDC089714]|uniref:amidase n=1 Tax=Paenarthrobacter sp. NPDC089714 TaxID=3364377 RepID=UPI0037F21400